MSEQIAHVCTGVGNKVKPIPQESCSACVAGPNMTVDDLCRHIESFVGHLEFSNAIRDGMAIKIDLLERQLAEARNLLAIIHRDGGHYTADHGLNKSCEDAKTVVSALRSDIERVTAERDGAQMYFWLAVREMGHIFIVSDAVLRSFDREAAMIERKEDREKRSIVFRAWTQPRPHSGGEGDA